MAWQGAVAAAATDAKKAQGTKLKIQQQG